MKREMRIAPLLFTTLILIIATLGNAENDPLPQRLQVLIDGYEREKERLLKPLEVKLDSELKALQLSFTKAGRLEDALAVSSVIASRAPAPPPEGPSWNDTRWRWGSGGELHLRADGTAMHTTWNRPGAWKVMKDGTIQMTSEYNSSTIQFLPNGTGVVTIDGGKSTTLTQIK